MQNGEYAFRREAALYNNCHFCCFIRADPMNLDDGFLQILGLTDISLSGLSSILFTGTIARYLVNQGCVKPLCDLLAIPEPATIGNCLDGLDNILKAGRIEKLLGRTGGVNPYVKRIEHCGGFDRIKKSDEQNYHNYMKMVQMLDMHWSKENYEETAFFPKF